MPMWRDLILAVVVVVCGLCKLTPYTDILGIKEEVHVLVFSFEVPTGSKFGFDWIVNILKRLKGYLF